MKILFSCAFAVMHAVCLAQECDGQLQVRIVDAHTHTAVPKARLLVDGKKHVEADSLGFALLTDLCPESIVLTCIPHFGCEPVEAIVQFPFDSLFVFSVEVHDEELDEQIVTAYRFNRDPRAVMSVDPSDLSAVRGSTLGDQVERIPGVTALRTGSNIVKPVINGLHSNRVVVVNNGVRQEGQQWGSEHAPEIDPNLASSLSVVQGASGLEYGPDAIGGALIVEPEPLRYRLPSAGWVKAGAATNGRALSSAALLGGSLFKNGNFAYRAHASGRMNGTLAAPDYLLANTAANEYSFSAAAGYKGTRFEADYFYSSFTTHLGIFAGSHIGNLTDLQAAIAGEEPKYQGEHTYEILNPKQFVQHQLNRAKLVYRWTEKVSTSLTAGYQYNLRREYDTHKAYNDSIAALGLPDFELNLWTTTADLGNEWRHGERWTSRFGASLFSQDNAYAGRFFIPNFRKLQYGAWYLLRFAGKKWNAEAGARFDRSALKVYYYEGAALQTPERNFSGISSSVGFSRLLGHHWNVRLNAGTAWRPPSVNELYSKGLHHGAAAIENGNAGLQTERSLQLQTGVHYKSGFAEIELNAFANRMNGYISLIPSFPPALTIAGAFPVFGYRQLDAMLSGVNFSADLRFLRIMSWSLRGSLLNAVSLDNDSLLYGIPYNRITSSLGLRVKRGERWQLFAEISGQMVFARDRASFIPDYAADPDGYFLLGGSLGVDWFAKEKQKIQVVLTGSNLLNTRYRDYLNRFRYYADELGTNLNLTIRVPFQLTTKQKRQ
jgi:iron complex outermembrane recepter protein